MKKHLLALTDNDLEMIYTALTSQYAEDKKNCIHKPLRIWIEEQILGFPFTNNDLDVSRETYEPFSKNELLDIYSATLAKETYAIRNGFKYWAKELEKINKKLEDITRKEE